MTVGTLINRVVYVGAGIVGPFSIDFPFLDNADIKVIKTLIAAPFTETPLVLTTDYTLTGAGTPLGGTLTLTVALPATHNLTIYRDPAATQGIDYKPNDSFPAETHERGLDRLTMLAQRFTDILSRAFRLSDGDTSGISTTMPTPVTDAFLKINSARTGLEWALMAGTLVVSAFGQTLLNAANAAAARALLLITAFGDSLILAADAVAARIILGFSAIAAKGDLFVGTAANVIATLTVGAEGGALVADPAQAKGMQWVRLGAGDKRQCVLSAALDASGYNAAITTGAGLRPGLDAAPTPMVLTFAGGYGAIGAQDLVATLSVDVADIIGANLPLSNTSFLHATWVSLSSVTWASCLINRQEGYAFDRSKQALLNFEAADATVAMIDDGGNTWAASGNAQIDTAKSKFGASSLLVDGVGDGIICTNITTLGDGSWEISLWFNINALPGVGVSAILVRASNAAGFGATIAISNTAGVSKLLMLVSTGGAANDVANQLGTNTVWALNQWNRVRFVFDALAGTYRFYLSLNGVAETLDNTVASSSRVCALTTFRLGFDEVAGQGFNGWIDAFRFLPCATNTTTETPAAVAPTITDHPIHFLSIPEMKMYEVTGASAVAGTNPTMTQRFRLFNAEADTSGVAVTAVRNYAIRGQFIDTWTTPLIPAATAVSRNHKIGITPDEFPIVELEAVTTNSGYLPGDRISIPFGVDASFAFPLSVWKARNTCGFTTGDVNNPQITIKTASGGRITPTAAHWKYRVNIKRGW